MSEVINNSLRGVSGLVNDSTLAGTAKVGTVTAMAQGDRFFYHASNQISIGTGYRRPDAIASSEGFATGALVPSITTGTTWSTRVYMVQGSLGTNAWESRWIMDLGTSHGLVIRPNTANGTFFFRLQPRDLAADWINHSSSSGTNPGPNTPFRLEVRRNGSQLRVEVFHGANIDGRTANAVWVWNSVSGLAGNFVRLTGFRYRGNILLQVGSTGSAVTSRQNQLIRLGYLPSGSADGAYGPQTANAVLQFQIDYAMDPADGEIGPETAAALDQAIRDLDGVSPRTPLRYWEMSVLNTASWVGPFQRSVAGPAITATAATTGDAGDKHVDVGVEMTASASVNAEVIARAPFSFPLGLSTEIQLSNGEWVDISGDVRATHDVTISRGRQDEGSDVDASRMSLVLNNRHGKYSPRNPNSEYFGQLGRNTPIRFSVRGPGVNPFRILTEHTENRSQDGTPVAIAPSVDLSAANAQIFTVWLMQASSGSELITPGEMVEDYSVSQGFSTAGFAREMRIHPGPTGTREATTVEGTPTNWSAITIAAQGQLGVPIMVDQVFASQDGTDNVTLSGVTPVQRGNVIIAIQAWDHDQSGEMLPPDNGPWSLVSDTSVEDGFVPRIQVWSRRVSDQMDLNVEFQGPSYNRDQYYAAYVINDLTTPRFTGEVSAWPQTWDLSGNDVWVDIDASGLLRRLVQGSPPARSAFHRQVQLTKPVGYWPLTEPSGSRENAPVVGAANVRPFDVRRSVLFRDLPDYGSGTLAPWMESVVGMNQGSEGRLLGNVDAGASNSWVCEFVRSGPGGDFQFRVRDDGDGTPGNPETVIRITQNVVNNNIVVNGSYTSDDGTPTNFTVGTVSNAEIYEGGPYLIRLTVTPNGSASTATIHVNGSQVLSGTTTGRVMRPPKSFAAQWDATGDNELVGEMSLGHVVFWDASEAPTPQESFSALMGHRHETAGRRLERLCAEENVAFEFIGDLDDTLPMGPQPAESFIDLLRDCADTDGGVLGESRRSVALLYRSRQSKYNQVASVEFDYTASHVGDIVVTDDDQRVANDVSVSTRFGGETTIEVDTGPMSVLAPPLGVGRYAESVEANPVNDTFIGPIAGWHAHLGTVDEARYPEVQFIRGTSGIRNDEDLVGNLNAVDFGGRVTIDNPPEWLPPGQMNLMVEGYTERLNLFEWDTELHCTPGSTWNVGEVVGVEPVFDGFNGTEVIPRTNVGDVDWGYSANFTPYEGTLYLDTPNLGPGDVAEVQFELPEGSQWVEFVWGAAMRSGNIDSFEVFEDSELLMSSTVNTAGWNRVKLLLTGGDVLRFVLTRGDTGSGTVTVSARLDAMSIGVDQRVNATPASTRVDTDTSVLFDEIASSTTVFDVSVLEGPAWITSGDEFDRDFPFDILVGGEQMRVTGITGEGPVQEFSVERSVNGVSKSHPTGADVRLFVPPVIGL